MRECKHCKTPTENPKFCSRSCAAKETNKIPKRKRTRVCKTCSSKVRSGYIYCTSCREERKLKLQTLNDVVYHKHHKSSAFALVRARARKVAKKLGWDTCVECGYDKHVEIAHIKPLFSFPLSTKLSVVNNPSNLKALCPNCHWEFDHLNP